MASTAGSVFCKVLEPPERVVYWLCVLAPSGADIPASDFEPMINYEVAILVRPRIRGKISYAVEMRHSAPLPFGDPVKTDHTGTL